MADKPRFALQEIFPSLADELNELLQRQGELALAAQVAGLAIVDRCRCGDNFCATIYTEPQNEGGYGPNHDTFDLDAKHGMILLDVVNKKIAAVEILDRDEFRKQLLAILP